MQQLIQLRVADVHALGAQLRLQLHPPQIAQLFQLRIVLRERRLEAGF